MAATLVIADLSLGLVLPGRTAAPQAHVARASVPLAVGSTGAEPPPAVSTSSGLDGDLKGRTFYADKLCEDSVVEEVCEVPGDDEFTVAILGDLHLDPRKMEDYEVGRQHFLPILEDAKSRGVGTALVSLGDLGESKSVRPSETDELFAGTTECHELAADFLGSFGVPYEVIGGNHDLEGIDEFATDEANLEAFCRIHGKERMQFCNQIAEKTLLVGLGSTVRAFSRRLLHSHPPRTSIPAAPRLSSPSTPSLAPPPSRRSSARPSTRVTR